MCIFHLINDLIIKILMVASYQETNDLKIREEFRTTSLCGKCLNLSRVVSPKIPVSIDADWP